MREQEAMAVSVAHNHNTSSRLWPVALVSTVILLALILILYQQTLVYLIGLWNQLATGEYAHGYLVLAISLYLIVRNRRRLAALTPCPDYRALPAVAASSLLWLVAVLVDVNLVQTVALLLLLVSVMWLLLGTRIGRELVFPILFIAFALPIWFPLSPLLQELTAEVVFWLIRLFEVPAFREENMILLPAGTLSVEESCAGLRYLLAALTLGTLYAWLNFRGLRARLIVVLICAFTAVLANIVRVFIVVYLAFVTEMQHPLVHDHLMLGWYLFGGMVAILLLVDARLSRHYQQPGPEVREATTFTEPDPQQPVAANKSISSYMVVLLAGALMMALGPAVAYSVNNRTLTDSSLVELELPAGVGEWISQDEKVDDWLPVYHGAENRKSIYQKDGNQIVAYIGYYPVQQQGEELINELNHISNEDIWRKIYTRARIRGDIDHQVLEQLLQKADGSQRLVWYWYNVSGHITVNKYEAKLLQVLGLLTGRHYAYVAAAATDLDETADSARERLRGFVTAIGPSLKK
jgi:exosortase A